MRRVIHPFLNRKTILASIRTKDSIVLQNKAFKHILYIFQLFTNLDAYIARPTKRAAQY